jgi:hypothetical protein
MHQLEVERRIVSDTAKPTKQSAPRSNLARRLAITVVLSAVFSLALWLMALSAMTSLIAGTGADVIILAASSTSDVLNAILETIGGFVLGLLAAIGAILGAMFGWLVE